MPRHKYVTVDPAKSDPKAIYVAKGMSDTTLPYMDKYLRVLESMAKMLRLHIVGEWPLKLEEV